MCATKNIYIDTETVDNLFKELPDDVKGDRKLVKTLMGILWTEQELGNRCRNQNISTNPLKRKLDFKELTPEKHKFIKGM